jgi:hypothetical protein
MNANFMKMTSNFVLLLIFVSFRICNSQQRDIVNGNLIQFNDNGFWCWYQDERAVVDIASGKIIVASAACGGSRNGADDAVIFNLQTGTSMRYVLKQWSNNPDDHNSAGLIIRPDGKYLAMYDQHYENFTGTPEASSAKSVQYRHLKKKDKKLVFIFIQSLI